MHSIFHISYICGKRAIQASSDVWSKSDLCLDSFCPSQNMASNDYHHGFSTCLGHDSSFTISCEVVLQYNRLSQIAILSQEKVQMNVFIKTLGEKYERRKFWKRLQTKPVYTGYRRCKYEQFCFVMRSDNMLSPSSQTLFNSDYESKMSLPSLLV